MKVRKSLTGTHREVEFVVGRRIGLGWPLMDYLRAIAPRYEPELIQLWAQRGDLTVDGGPCCADQPVVSGQRVLLKAPLPPADPGYTPPPLDLVYADEHFALANKQPGHLAHQAGRIMTGTLLNQLQDLMLERGKAAEDVRLVNRIDRDTSGLVLVSFDLPTHVLLAKIIEERRMRKEYRALCHGLPTSVHGHWTDPIGPSDRPSVRRMVRPDGQPCHTEFQVEAAAGEGPTGFARLNIILHTGRQHQIRLHASHHGHPLIGDWVYGQGCEELPGQALHAAAMEFAHPHSGEVLRVEAPLPKVFDELWNNILTGPGPTPRELTTDQRSKLGLDGPDCV